MNILLSQNNHLLQLARSGQRLPHIILAIVLSFAFVLLAQLIGVAPAIIIVLILSVNDLGQLTGPEDFMSLIDTAFEQALFLILLFGPIFLILWAWLTLYEKRPLWTIGLERPGAVWKYGRGLVVGLLMFGAAIGLSAALGYIAIEETSSQPQGFAALGGVLLVFIGWFVQGSAEEAITRGWLLPVVGARYHSGLGIIVSALAFALFHALNFNLSLIALMNLFLFGFFAALYALYEDGLWGVFSIHTVWNWVQGNLFGFEVSGNPASGGTLFNLMEVGPDIITGGAFGPEGGLSVTVILIISCLAVWGISRRKESREAQPVIPKGYR